MANSGILPAVNGDLGHASVPSSRTSSVHLVGDLLWSRVTGHPYWPCMVSYDPLEGIYMKTKMVGRSSATVYHVQYFGDDAHHGWTTPKNVILFEGLDKFHSYIETKKSTAKKLMAALRHKEMAKYVIPSSRRRSWDVAVGEAELALKLPRKERLERFLFRYHVPPSKTSVNGTASQSNLSNGIETNAAEKVETNGVGKADREYVGSKKCDFSAARRVESVCTVCEKIGADVACTGTCLQYFHSDCLGLVSASKYFRCAECMSGRHICFSCKSSEGETKKCSNAGCGKYYHVACLEKYATAVKKKFICPLHSCHSCYNDHPENPNVFKSRLVKCFRCPTAFHARDSCIAAGSVQLVPFSIICPDHFVIKKYRTYQTVVNISWCASCGGGGKLICCDSCPLSFHPHCLGVEVPDESYFCDDCVSRKHIRYGMIVWVKVGVFRWWPAKVLHPRNVPYNILKLKHSAGEFPIQYYGTKEYYWTHRGRVFEFCEEDKCSNRSEIRKMFDTARLSSMELKYKKGLEDSIGAFDVWIETIKPHVKGLNAVKPKYKHIRSNRAFGNVKIITYCDRSTQCVCDPQSENPCGYDSDCLNRSMFVECNPLTCRAKDKCQNQKFARREYPQLIPFQTLDRGWALKTLQDIKAGHFIIEYVGDLIDEEECKKRLNEKHEADDTNYYFLTLDKDRIIDAGPRGNFSRFMNHSCSPNCETQKWIVNGDLHVGLFAKFDILAGSELTFDYKLDSLNNAKLKCLCGSDNCHGAIGEKPQNTQVKNESKAKLQQKPRKRKIGSYRQKKDDYCYICKDVGELVICDRKGCSRAYHVSCLKREKVPHGLWQCPWHYCDECGRVSQILCSKCPNSVCVQHKKDTEWTEVGGQVVCSDHADNVDDVSGSEVTENMELD